MKCLRILLSFGAAEDYYSLYKEGEILPYYKL